METIKDIQLGSHWIGDNHPPFIIAEMSGNHNQSLERALSIVEAAAQAGAHAIKLQTYTPATMTIPGALTISSKDSLWAGKDLYALYEEAYTPWEWHEPLFRRAKELGLFAFSTPFDESAVDFLESLDVGAYKIASFENTDWPLLRAVARTGKPVIISTGASSLADIDSAVHILRTNGCKELILLKCTSTYPASPADSNILTIPHLRSLFGCTVGLSDHTPGIGVALASVALGARVVEKHFTLRRSDGGVDSAFSIEPDELEHLVEESARAFHSLGKIHYGILEKEKDSLLFKRSIYVVKAVKTGEPLTTGNTRVIRPGLGLPPRYLDLVIGRVARVDIPAGTPLKWEMV
jgi:pseudaminic acid synthase